MKFSSRYNRPAFITAELLLLLEITMVNEKDTDMAAAPPAYEQVVQIQDGAPISSPPQPSLPSNAVSNDEQVTEVQDGTPIFESVPPQMFSPLNVVSDDEHSSRPPLAVIQDHTQTTSGSSLQAGTPSTQLGSETLVTQSSKGEYTLAYNMLQLPESPQPSQSPPPPSPKSSPPSKSPQPSKCPQPRPQPQQTADIGARFQQQRE